MLICLLFIIIVLNSTIHTTSYSSLLALFSFLFALLFSHIKLGISAGMLYTFPELLSHKLYIIKIFLQSVLVVICKRDLIEKLFERSNSNTWAKYCMLRPIS